MPDWNPCNCFFTLRAQVVILECVQPAVGNSFVEAEIGRFLELSGYHCSQCDLHLQDLWPCRRSRAWWVITSPMIGKVPLVSWPRMTSISKYVKSSLMFSHGM